MNHPGPNNESACWSSYWAGGAMTSLPEDFRTNYDGEIEAFWRAQAEQLGDSARVLDVCTGNGAVALLMALAARELGRRFRITAVDAAQIHPEIIRQRFPDWSPLMGDVRFVGERPFESIAVEPGSIDLITSQYGIEYCHWPSAAAKCVELLRPGGRLVLVSHSLTSDMLKTMKQEQAEYERIDRLGVVELLSRLLDGRLDDASARGRLEEMRRSLEAVPDWRASGLYNYVHGLLTQTLAMSRRQLHRYADPVRSACRQLEDGYARLTQMLRVNQALHDNPDWTEVFVKAGLDRIDAGALTYRQTHRVGDYFVFERPSV